MLTEQQCEKIEKGLTAQVEPRRVAAYLCLHMGLTLAEAAADAHINARGLVPDVPLPLAEGRTVRQLGCPIKLSDCPAAYRHAGYPEGWHTEAVLTGLGYTAEEIRDLSE